MSESALGQPTSSDRERSRVAALRDYEVVGAEDLLPGERDLIEGELRPLTELARRICVTPSAVVNLLDDAHQHQVAAVGFVAGMSAKAYSMCAVALTDRRTVVVPDATRDIRFRHSPWVRGELGAIRYYAASPLITPAGYAIGTLCTFSEQPREPQADEIEGLDSLAAMAVQVLELRRRTLQLRSINTELARSHRQLAAFAGQVSHDLKTPLTAINGFSELAQDSPAAQGDAQLLDWLERTVSAGSRMMLTIDDLLKYASVGGVLNQECVAVRSVLGEIVNDLGVATDEASIRCEDVDVWADRVQFRLLLQNLITNSLRYGRLGTSCEITITASRRNGGVELRVADNGEGIPADRRGAVLSPLVRLRKEIPGTGLGLATCERIVVAHHGELTISETAGGGATVCVLLPDPSSGTPLRTAD
ncbi:MAG: sensor signal transduction histidine kinase [Frankiales bacterium]|nr:sensor signal transduction histidine kinase [Frankiales bacterium]